MGKSPLPSPQAKGGAFGKAPTPVARAQVRKAMPKSSGQSGQPGQGRPAPVAPKFDLTTSGQEYQRRRQLFQTYFTNWLIPIDNYYERRRTTDWITIQGPQGNIVYQVQDQTIPNLVEKTIAYITPESITVSVPQGKNPMMDDEQREIVANVIREVWDQDQLYAPGDPLYERLRMLMLRGTYVAQYEWLAPDVADQLTDGWPFRVHLHDIFESAWVLDANNRVESIIIQKKVFASDVPDPMLKKVGQDFDPADELEMYLYYDRVQWGVLLNNVIVQPLEPHGYFYPDGATPMCPFVVAMYRPRDVRNGFVGPQVSGFSQIGQRIGIPPTFYLRDTSEIISRIQTVEMENIRRIGLAPIIESGRVKRPNDQGLDLTEIAIEVDNGGKVEVLQVPNVNNVSQAFVQDIRDNYSAPAGMGNEMMRGQGTAGTTGIAQSGQTSSPRSFAQQLSICLKKNLEMEAHVIVGCCVSHLQASVAQQVRHQTGEILPTTGGDDDPLAQGVEFPFSEQFTGSAEPITDLTFYGFRRAVIDVTPDTHLSPESLLQAGTQLLMAKDPQTGKPIMPVGLIVEKFMPTIFDDPNEVDRAMKVSEMAAQPGNPLSNIGMMEAVLNHYGARFQPAQRIEMQQQLDQYIATNLPGMFSQLMTTGSPNNSQANPPPAQSSGPPPPGGQPPPGGPPGGAPPAPAPQLPNVQPPGGPGAVPPGAMQPGAGNPAAAMPPPPNPVPPGPVFQ